MRSRGEGTSETAAQPGVAAAIGAIVAAGLAVTGWRFIGPDHIVYAVVVQGGFTFLGLLAGPLFVDTARRRYAVSSAEPRIHALLGADALRRLLGRIGWNSVIDSPREHGEGHTRRTRLLRGTELSETGHIIAGVATLLLAAAAVGTAHVAGAVQIILVGLPLHAYPIMIQRIVRQRLRHPHHR
ncbi:hypothetical protein H9L21_07240 [Aeromicrobium senzhongii]|uniref:Glycosyl-4,4'-diaponeurosporenoate acyltransferase n=1 Tax=Aeromicrobium senzhongii TaxID=2663859 RepID=A0ABX6SZJ3_9ACTN|nr:hypothetical protein [Aeromicrobium senzhongii]MTB87240.1 hypothetical protein [Aeromicrobium senzhongii]QNL95690.1 hypothetical protein H9L21_07240 [Aeromicrobium senzhongii]